jgi:hypothetical protein
MILACAALHAGLAAPLCRRYSALNPQRRPGWDAVEAVAEFRPFKKWLDAQNKGG